MTCTQSKCKYPVTCDYNNDCMEQLVKEANKRRRMNFKKALKIVLELASKEADNNQAIYDVPDGADSITLETIEQAFDVIEEEVENLPY
jgi:tRNA G26 N,N-dimethylase Trm1